MEKNYKKLEEFIRDYKFYKDYNKYNDYDENHYDYTKTDEIKEQLYESYRYIWEKKQKQKKKFGKNI
jgi:hypothetical protein